MTGLTNDNPAAATRDVPSVPRGSESLARDRRRVGLACVFCSVFGLVWGEALPATAQPADEPTSPGADGAPSPPKKAAKEPAKPDSEGEDDDEGGEAGDAETDDEEEDEDDFPRSQKQRSVEELDEDLQLLGSGQEPPEPRAGDQEPGSVPESPPIARINTLEVGPLFGLSLRKGDSDRLSYSPAFAWGGYLKTDLLRFLSARVSYVNSIHEVDGKPLIEGVESGSYTDVSTFSLRFTLEPTWRWADLRAFGVLGVGWGKLRVDHVDSDDGFHLAASQAGVFIEYPLGIGLSYDLLDGWLTAGALYTFALHSKVTGNIYGDTRGITQDGQRVTIGGLPRVEYSQLVALTVAAVF